MTIHSLIFDLGGVLIDWNPRYLYRKLIKDEKEIEYFLSEICSPEWNAQLDAGLPFSEGVAMLKEKHPEYAELIEAYQHGWVEMLGGEDRQVVNILKQVKDSNMPVYALTNWSAETFPIAKERFDFLSWFDDIVVSGEVGLRKPDPKIFQLAIEQFNVNPAATIYIDDIEENVVVANRFGLQAIHFQDADHLRKSLNERGIFPAD